MGEGDREAVEGAATSAEPSLAPSTTRAARSPSPATQGRNGPLNAPPPLLTPALYANLSPTNPWEGPHARDHR